MIGETTGDGPIDRDVLRQLLDDEGEACPHQCVHGQPLIEWEDGTASCEPAPASTCDECVERFADLASASEWPRV